MTDYIFAMCNNVLILEIQINTLLCKIGMTEIKMMADHDG